MRTSCVCVLLAPRNQTLFPHITYLVGGVLGQGGVQCISVPWSKGNRERVKGLGLEQLQRDRCARVQRLELHGRRGVRHLDEGLLLVGAQGGGFDCHAFAKGRRAHHQALQVDEAALVHFDAALGVARFGVLAVFGLHQRGNTVLVRRADLIETVREDRIVKRNEGM